jgi:hypothetical protein
MNEVLGLTAVSAARVVKGYVVMEKSWMVSWKDLDWSDQPVSKHSLHICGVIEKSNAHGMYFWCGMHLWGEIHYPE